MSTTIPDYTEAEQKLVSASLFERYGNWRIFLPESRGPKSMMIITAR
jgi:hypothetical protein